MDEAEASSLCQGQPPFLEVKNLTKRFPGVIANDRVSLAVCPGEVHALLGENGAGKSTLVSILYGLLEPDGGEIRIRGRPVVLRSPRDALRLGIGLVPQHFLLVKKQTVAENVALGLGGLPFYQPARALAPRIRELGERYGLPVDPEAYVWQLSAGEQQRVEILKVLVRDATLLMLDEPTSVLTPQEARGLFQVLKRMKAEGHAVIFITHKLEEVLAVADRVTVLRQGRVVATLDAPRADRRTLARLMVGEELPEKEARRRREPGREVLFVEDLWVRSDRGFYAVKDASFVLREGEIVGLAGVAGNGQSELIEALTGLRRPERGWIRVGERNLTGKDARVFLEAGVAHVPEDRNHRGVVGSLSVAENLVLRHYRYPPFARGPVLDRRRIRRFAEEQVRAYGIKTPSIETPVRLLSGGNVQKLILARELYGDPKVLIAAHPTYGLDVGAAHQVHERLLAARDRGAAILLASEDLEEILKVSDRILVIFEGRIVAELAPEEATKEQLGMLMAGVAA